MNPVSIVRSPDDPRLGDLCRQLAAQADELDQSGRWPAEQLELCARYGVHEWFLPEAWGGQGWSEAQLVAGYLRLAEACLTTTFILTQRVGACRRIAGGCRPELAAELLPGLIRGQTFATVGISHLTTSRRHLDRPVLRAEADGDEFVLDGFSPWVTGGAFADTIVLGATLDDGRQILAALPSALEGVEPQPRLPLVALAASHTAAVECHRVRVPARCVLAGPVENVMAQGSGAGTGGLQTSTLAAGLAAAAISLVEREARRRGELAEPARGLRDEQQTLGRNLLEAAAGTGGCTADQIRARANSLVLRATQAALAAAKGTGFVAGHPAGRWCREALFFLVWSCPPSVIESNLCELAGLAD